jgi:hypothetical protein
MDEEEFLSIVFINETPPGPPAGRPRWYCYEREPGFDTPEEGVAWAAPRFDRVMVRPLTGVYYWVNQPPSEWEEEGAGPLKQWPPSEAERLEIDQNYEATVERYAEANRLAPAFAEEIVRRLSAALPEPWSVQAKGPDISLTHRGARFDQFSLLDQEMHWAYRGVLDWVQSEISEETTDAWPYDSKRGMHMWEPEVRLLNNTLRAWYGPEDDPVLTFEPIKLAELRAR